MHVVDRRLELLDSRRLEVVGYTSSTCGGFYVMRARGTGPNENRTVGLRET
jgi:hypothetical protein